MFIDGCFWHGCPEHGQTPAANRDWWAAKIRRNQERDAQTTDLLSVAGWRTLRVWEHEEPLVVATRVRGLLRPL